MTTGQPQLGSREYLCYHLLVALEEVNTTSISRSKFLKLSCITDHYLQNTLGVEIELPRYWYIYGEALDEHALNGDFYHAPAAKYWNGQEYIPVNGLSEWEFAASASTKAAIDDAIDWTVEQLGQKNTDEITQFQFDHLAPNEFIRTLDALRRWLDRTDYNQQSTLGDFEPGLKSTRRVVETALDRLEATYPADDYPELYKLFLQWHRTVKALLEHDPDYAVVAEFLDSFINALSRVELRFHHCQYIPDERIRAWEADRIEAKEMFRNTLRKRRMSLLDTNGETSQSTVSLK